MKVYRPVQGRLRVQWPVWYAQRNLQHLGCRNVVYSNQHRCWLVARGKMHTVVDYLRQYGDVEVYIDGKVTQKCDTRCTQAKGDDCVCSCAGANHQGTTSDGWHQVGETTLINTETTRSHYTVTKGTP